jgi:hypothetical protein
MIELGLVTISVSYVRVIYFRCVGRWAVASTIVDFDFPFTKWGGDNVYMQHTFPNT